MLIYPVNIVLKSLQWVYLETCRVLMYVTLIISCENQAMLNAYHADSLSLRHIPNTSDRSKTITCNYNTLS